MSTDEQIKVDITKQLQWDARIDASDISITVDSGSVDLKGSVPSITAKTAAYNDAHLVDGVVSVNNNIKVEFPESKTVPSDSEIRENAIRSLSFDSDLESYKIDVDVDQGWITLEGTVNAYWEKVAAENDVSDINGVIEVSNNLGVVPTENYIDENIAEDIVNALERNVHVNADDIDVRVEDGVVTLDGTVRTMIAKNAAFDAALYTPGVVTINNRIIVN
ncbi:BON domain-containing protein [Fodinibius sp. AD559]|uniref:BON domain-containing protein n=1 Tax=Fodinibius sp. AD559 TaxID=3424179 RepID=UPI00404702D2